MHARKLADLLHNVAKRIRNKSVKLLYILYNIFSDEHVCRETKELNDLDRYTHAIHIHNSQLASSLSSGVVLECGCEYYGSSVDAAGGRGSIEKINSCWRRLPRV